MESYAGNINFYFQEITQKLIIQIVKHFRLDHDILAALCVSNLREKLELKIDNVFFLCSQSILKINQVTYNVVFAVKVRNKKNNIRTI